jgi:hypothetical protein
MGFGFADERYSESRDKNVYRIPANNPANDKVTEMHTQLPKLAILQVNTELPRFRRAE